MWDKLEKIFIELKTEYARQGSFAKGDTIPPSLFTFWNYDTPEEGYYDNESHRAIWSWQVCFYTTDATVIYSKMQEFINLAKRDGFIVEDRGHDIVSEKPNYFGRMVRIFYIESYNKKLI